MFDLAYAADTATSAPDPAMANTIFVILLMAIIYFLFFRPQQKRMRAHQEMTNSITRGDSIVTSGGILGKVVRVHDQEEILEVEIADNVVVKVARRTVREVTQRTAVRKNVPESAGKPAASPSKDSKPSRKKG